MLLRIGHRGAAGTHPENTLAAFRRAAELGAHGIEFDVHRSADGHLVVIHDATMDRTTSSTGLVMSLTLEQIKQADAGVKKGPEFAGERVPTLRELIQATPPELKLILELKAGSIRYPGIEEDIVKLIREEGAQQRFQISSFDHKALHRIHELAPELSLGMLTVCNHLDPVAMARAIGADSIHPKWEFVTPELVQEAHAAGITVITWTVNEPMFIGMMKQCGVDGIMSDFPDRI